MFLLKVTNTAHVYALNNMHQFFSLCTAEKNLCIAGEKKITVPSEKKNSIIQLLNMINEVLAQSELSKAVGVKQNDEHQEEG